MGVNRGPKIVTDGLVFGYDADDRSTRFYPGEPTTNLVSSDGWSHSYGISDNYSYVLKDVSTANDNISEVMELTINGISAGPGATGASLTSGLTYTVSFWARSTSTEFSWNYNYIIQSGSNIGLSTITFPVQWTRISKTFVAISNQTNTARMTFMSNGNGLGKTAQIYNVQIEQKPHATQFTPTSRSATQGLLDLTGNNTIDLSNVSFDSTAHPTFDGTNDISIDDTIFFTNEWTWEVIVKYNSVGSTYNGIVWGEGNVEVGYSGWQYLLAWYNNSYFHYRVNNSVTGWTNTNYTPSGFAATDYNHLVWNFNNGTTKLYINSILVHTDTSRGVYDGGTTSKLYVGGRNDGGYRSNAYIPVTKFYDRDLTQQEITQNFNAYRHRFGI